VKYRKKEEIKKKADRTRQRHKQREGEREREREGMKKRRMTKRQLGCDYRENGYGEIVKRRSVST